ncbi:MAG TPA: PQQ-dependent sugar dehydrogenase [Geminicoccaceae bacterium]
MTRQLCVGAVSALALFTVASAPAHAVDINLEEVATGLTAPLAMAQPAGDDRIFIIEQPGMIKILQNGELLDEPFLDIRHKIVDLHHEFDERGLIGLAFHPDFANNGKFYVAYSAPLVWQGDLAQKFWWDHTNTVSEFTVSSDDQNVADLNSERIVHQLNWPQFNHNGHWLGFGPDGMLYISTGDGGYANDWGIGHEPLIGNGQEPADLHGKILRIDVEPSEGMGYTVPDDNPFVDDPQSQPEIWALGLRNPWRCSFDMGGDNALICGDVQQNSFEEVSVINAGDNLGWREMEATHCFDFEYPNQHPEDCDKSQYVLPILEYKNCTAQPDGCMGISVTGGYVYRGSHSEWDGKYIFGDWSKNFATMDGQIFVATKNGDSWSMEQANVTNMDGPLPYVLAFGQDAEGEVYVLTSITTGPNGGQDSIYRIKPAS